MPSAEPKSGGNGKGNGRGTHPNSLANLKPIKPGQKLPPRTRKPRFMDYLREALSAEVDANGKKIPVEKAMAELLVRRAVAHLAPGQDWCKSIDHVLGRISPIPRMAEEVDYTRETALFAKVDPNDNAIRVGFVEKVKVHSGRGVVTADDVLDFLDDEIEGKLAGP